MKVLVVDPPLFTLPYDLHFCRSLAAAGTEVTLIGRPPRAYEAMAAEPFAFQPLFYQRSESRGERWRTSPATKLLKAAEHVVGWWALDRLVARVRPEIVHLQWLVIPVVDGFFLRRIARRTRLVLTVHNASLMAHSSAAIVGRLGAQLQQVGQQDLLGVFDRFIAHTEQSRAHLAALGVEPWRISVLAHPPLDLAASVLPEKKPGGGVRILFFGSIKPYKGVDVLVRAGIELMHTVPECRIDIVGRPFADLTDLKALVAAAKLGDRFGFDLRYVPDQDLAGYLAAADIVVFPYREIDASGALALAVAQGLPIVASAIGVFSEPPVAEHVRRVPPDDPQALAVSLRELVTDEAARARLAAGSCGQASCHARASPLAAWSCTVSCGAAAEPRLAAIQSCK